MGSQTPKMIVFAFSLVIALSLVAPHAIAVPNAAAAAAAVPAVQITSRSGSGSGSGSQDSGSGPGLATGPDNTRFSFAAWVDTIVANPETALKPREAVQAFIDSLNATAGSGGNGDHSSTGLDRRWDDVVICRTDPDEGHAVLVCSDISFCICLPLPSLLLARSNWGFTTQATDAAHCIQDLAARSVDEPCDILTRKYSGYRGTFALWCDYQSAQFLPCGNFVNGTGFPVAGASSTW